MGGAAPAASHTLDASLFAAMEGEPEAQQALDLIRDVYAVEHTAKERDILGTPEHLALRQAESAPLMDKLKSWLESRQGLYPPKSKLGIAIRYALRQWAELTVFLDDPTVPLDNNQSEAALRVVALGRKNLLFVGNEDAGDNIAGLYSLVATCEANDANPIDYLRDVLLRISTHPADASMSCFPIAGNPHNRPSYATASTAGRLHRRELGHGGELVRQPSRRTRPLAAIRGSELMTPGPTYWCGRGDRPIPQTLWPTTRSARRAQISTLPGAR